MATRKGSSSGIEVPSNAELRRRIRSDRSTPRRVTAIAELVQRAPRGLDRMLTELALDAGLDVSLRVDAVASLGREATASALQGLRSVVSCDAPDVARRAIERLGKVGTPDDVELLRGVRTRDRVTARVLRTAKCFLSYRHRLGAYRVDAPKERLAAPERAPSIRVGRPSETMQERFALLAARVPGIALTPQPARHMECGPNDLALLLNTALLAEGPATLRERQAIPAVLTRYNDETGAYDPAYYLLSDPIRGSEFRLVGVRGSGRSGLHGAGSVGHDTIAFEVNATEDPLDHPLTIQGSFDLRSGDLRIEVARVAPQFSDAQQRRRKQPRPVDLRGHPL